VPGLSAAADSILTGTPTYKLMATFNSATDSSGRKVVRCFVKGAAPAVMGRTATALAARTSVPWDADLKKRAEDAMLRMEGEGHRVMAAAFRDLDPATFDAKGDLLGPRHRSRTDLAGRHGRPARDESKAAVLNAHGRRPSGLGGDRRSHPANNQTVERNTLR